MVGAFDLTDTAGAGRQRRQFRVPAALVGRDVDDAPVADMRVDDAAATAIMPASAGDDALARLRRDTRRFVKDLAGYSGLLLVCDRLAISRMQISGYGLARQNSIGIGSARGEATVA
jgi:hypothetical protein